MVNDPIGDLIARIKNAASRGRGKVSTPASKMRARVLDILIDEGYIAGYRLVEKAGAFPEFEIELKYVDGAAVPLDFTSVSKPGRRIYSSVKDLKRVKNGLGISILPTPDASLTRASGVARERQSALGISDAEQESQAALAWRLRLSEG